jgi:uncharacterized protein (DUF849 family)
MPLVQAALNGGRTDAGVPQTPAELAAAARAAAAAGARSLHLHPRDADGRESLARSDVDAAVAAVRAACPGLEVGVTTGLWIAGDDPEARLAALAGWTVLPDMVSWNLYEAGAPELGRALLERGIALEAGLDGPDEVELLVASGLGPRCLRILIEPTHAEPAEAVAAARATHEALLAAGLTAPQLHHGADHATWAVVRAALEQGIDVRVGMEDTLTGPDGRPADNAAQVTAALRLA